MNRTRRPWWRRRPPAWTVLLALAVMFVAACVVVELTTDETSDLTCYDGRFGGGCYTSTEIRP